MGQVFAISISVFSLLIAGCGADNGNYIATKKSAAHAVSIRFKKAQMILISPTVINIERVDCGEVNLNLIVDLSFDRLVNVVGDCHVEVDGEYRAIMTEGDLRSLEEAEDGRSSSTDLIFGLTDYGRIGAEPTLCKDLAPLTTGEIELSRSYSPLSLDEIISILRFENGVSCAK